MKKNEHNCLTISNYECAFNNIIPKFIKNQNFNRNIHIFVFIIILFINIEHIKKIQKIKVIQKKLLSCSILLLLIQWKYCFYK